MEKLVGRRLLEVGNLVLHNHAIKIKAKPNTPYIRFVSSSLILRKTADPPTPLVERSMDASDRRYFEEEDSSLTKTMKGAATGLAAGTIWGTVVATWLDVPRVERNVALPGLIRTLKMMGNHGLTFAAIGGVYIGVEQLTQNYRQKRDFVNGAVGGFVAGAAILGFKGKSISTALSAGAALAATSAAIDAGGQTTRVDTGKEYYPYTTKKRADAAN
uniref:Mitochondrial inner membrane translocase subunit Tim17/Tim22/Tim23/peroxisomal protein PMP24 n=2 Tax=Helianthus annuus TaxID=4232 RepID=A0A251TJ91_HELAN